MSMDISEKNAETFNNTAKVLYDEGHQLAWREMDSWVNAIVRTQMPPEEYNKIVDLAASYVREFGKKR